MKVKSESEVAQSCPTLSDSMDCSPPGSFVHGIFQAKILEWAAIAFSILISACVICYCPIEKASHMTRFRGHVRRYYQRAWIEGHGQIGFITANNLQECLPPQGLPILPTAGVKNGTAQTLIPYMLGLPLSFSQHLQGSLDCVSVCA